MNGYTWLQMLWATWVSMFQIVFVYFRLIKVKKTIVTVFGGHMLPPGHEYLGDAAREIAYRLATCDMFVMTGGGSGIMQKVYEGTVQAQSVTGEKRCIGISVKGLAEGYIPDKTSFRLYAVMDTFSARKWVLMNFSSVFFFFPGGFGTLDEFMEVMTLLKTNKLDRRKIVLYGAEYWNGFFDWAKKELIARGFSDAIELEYFVIVDSIDEAEKQLKICCGCL